MKQLILCTSIFFILAGCIITDTETVSSSLRLTVTNVEFVPLEEAALNGQEVDRVYTLRSTGDTLKCAIQSYGIPKNDRLSELYAEITDGELHIRLNTSSYVNGKLPANTVPGVHSIVFDVTGLKTGRYYAFVLINGVCTNSWITF
ncbi:MAG: hypothetical protein LBT76_00320 [Tannerella sp.]|jgi:hypothetical protein|nr:hypothetical protein [Tannerella sp.]